MPEQSFEVVSIAEHTRNWNERFTISHTAKAVILNYLPENKNDAASEVSIKAGYHPAGYGIYHRYTNVEPTGNPNEYLVEWKTADNCD